MKNLRRSSEREKSRWTRIKCWGNICCMLLYLWKTDVLKWCVFSSQAAAEGGRDRSSVLRSAPWSWVPSWSRLHSSRRQGGKYSADGKRCRQTRWVVKSRHDNCVESHGCILYIDLGICCRFISQGNDHRKWNCCATTATTTRMLKNE